MTVKAKPLLSQSNRIFSLTFFFFVVGLAQSLHASGCEEPVGQAVSVQGQVEVLPSNEPAWIPLNLNDRLCPGDRLRVKADSRAGLLLHNDTLLRLDELTNVTVNAPSEDGSFWIELLKGVTHFISRVKGSFQVKTPYVNASIEGTEFVVKVDDRAADVVVFEGVVVASNTFGSIELSANQAARATRRDGPIRAAYANPRDAVAWTLYYPPLPEQPDEAYDLAQQAVTAIVQNRLEDAIGLAEQAIAANDQSAAACMAQSYVDQARFDIPAALANSRKAAELAPQSALTQARLAEVWLMNGETRKARSAAQKAVSLDPQLSLAHAALGFSSLREVNLDSARNAFEKAIRLDSAAPLPRFGLGLVKIRQGELESGRREIETAVLLDPNSALLRSYLGKAYYEEKRSSLAADQFAMAKTLDPNDPTAWFYDSILLQSENRPVEALQAQQQAIKLNDNRAVYRSRQLLDEDQAARSASQARIYDDLGFERLALKESGKSLAADPGNPSAHRFLSDSYANVPRHEIARVSELLQAQMLTPEIVTPVSPSASETNLLAFQGSGPSLTGYSEYNPMFNHQRLSAIVSGVAGSNNTRGQEIAVGGFTNRGMLSAGYFNEKSDGYRENNDNEQTISNLFGQLRLSSSLSVQGEVKHRENDFGDLRQRFDPELFSTIQRRSIESDSARIGVTFSPSPRHSLLYAASRLDLEDGIDQGTTKVDLKSDRDQHEVQYLYKGTGVDLIMGASRLSSDDDVTTTITIPSPFPPLPDIVQVIDSEAKVNQRTSYVYAHLPWKNGIGVLGVEYVDLEDEGSYDEQKYNPKLGLIWDFSQSIQLRLAAFKTLRGSLVNNQTLAPTQIAGFNQLLDDVLGTQARHYAAALDAQLGERLYGGIELTRRTATDFVSSSSQLEEDQEEQHHEAYLSWPFLKRFALTGRFKVEDYEREYVDGEFNFDRPARLKTETFALELNYHHPSGLFGSFDASHVDQEIANVLPTTGTLTENGSFWIGNLSLGMKLPKQTGMVEINVRNLFDREFNYQSIHPGTGTPKTSPYYPERSVFANLQLWF